ncbi:EAL domain-containing protein [Cyanobium sp. FGCU-52]|nr:EAL domain-containing protein [Cyanobium sp. FGCU52]
MGPGSVGGHPSRTRHRPRKPAAVVRATISVTRALGLLTLAEGVGTQGQFQTLLELGCDQVQGYQFDRPQPTESFERTLADVAGGAWREARQLTS